MMPNAVSAEAKRIERLHASFNRCLIEHDRCARWGDHSGAAAFATALKLIDACICAEQGDFEPGDRGVVARLREIALDRDVLRVDAPAAEGEAAAP